MPQALATGGPTTPVLYIATPTPATGLRVNVSVVYVGTGLGSTFPAPLALDMDAYLAPLLAEARRMGRIPEEQETFPFEPED